MSKQSLQQQVNTSAEALSDLFLSQIIPHDRNHAAYAIYDTLLQHIPYDNLTLAINELVDTGILDSQYRIEPDPTEAHVHDKGVNHHVASAVPVVSDVEGES